MTKNRPVVLITRTRPDADALAARIADLGYEPLIEPMLDVHATHLPMAGDPLCAEGLIVTSAQALRHLNTLVREIAFRHKPLYAVGPKTAALAVEMGWHNVHDGGGDVRRLGAFLQTRKEVTPSSRLVHICGRDIAKDTRAIMHDLPCKVWDWVVYETDPADHFSPTFDSYVQAGRLKAALFYSPRAAAVFRENVQAYKSREDIKEIILLCLSPSVLESLASMPNGGLYVAHTPDEDALLDLLTKMCPPPA